MKQTLKWAGLILLAVAAGLALAVLAIAGVRAELPIAQVQLQATPYPYNGPGMMGSWRSGNSDNQTLLSLDQAVDVATQSLAAYSNPDLQLTEVMEFSENFYAEVQEKSTGIHAFELLIDRYTGAVYPEPGPNMMWNTSYGHMGGMMGGMMGGRRGQAPDTMSVTSEQAQDFAQGWLDQYLPGTSAAEQADAFYGYYTIHVLKNGQVFGMLSVNGYTGDAWYHDWHGDFIDMKELEE